MVLGALFFFKKFHFKPVFNIYQSVLDGFQYRGSPFHRHRRSNMNWSLKKSAYHGLHTKSRDLRKYSLILDFTNPLFRQKNSVSL
jgi:hypothetical protein